MLALWLLELDTLTYVECHTSRPSFDNAGLEHRIRSLADLS